MWEGIVILIAMLTSVKWLNRYLDPSDVTPSQAEEVLTHVGFPIEGCESLADGDVRLDVELTSNRGDCLCHVGLAREIAAATGRRLVMPDAAVKEEGGRVGDATGVENRAPEVCPRFTARVIRGVKVGPSPAWLVEALESIGQHSINNVVDVSNYVLHEIGHPNHVFDLNTLSEKRLIVRYANEGERVKLLDGGEAALKSSELVVADAQRAVSLAGIMGGVETGVTERTTDVLLEVATWDPVLVRSAARRLGLRTDASHRFERYVDARDLAWASDRCARLIAEVAGGTVLEGMIDAGGSLAPKTVIELRVARCRQLIGVEIGADEMERVLRAEGFDVESDAGAGVLRCTVPHHRHDVTREVDLIEEVARLVGFERIRVSPRLDVHLELSHPPEWALRERAMDLMSRTLCGLGFYEAVTFSFLNGEEASRFVAPGLRLLKVDEERRKDTPYLRPSVAPSLLKCRRANQDARVRVDGGARLFETGSTFAEADDGDRYGRETRETPVLALIVDAPGKAEGRQEALRMVRGALEHVVQSLGGAAARMDVEPTEPAMGAYERGGFGAVLVNGARIGTIGVVERDTAAAFGLDETVAAGEVELGALVALYPPRSLAHALPAFPGIERDLSVVVDEGVAWKRVGALVEGMGVDRLEGHRFVGVYRGKQVGAGKKSVTFRLMFRDPTRTLRHEEVDPQVDMIIGALSREFGAELRA